MSGCSQMGLLGTTVPSNAMPAAKMPCPARLYSYIVARDYGFAPNPFYGFCTLATCKPQIRKKAEIGDWIIGTGSKKKGRDGRLVYAMRVTEVMSFDDYWADSRFHRKRPDMHASMKKAFGDNIYHRDNETQAHGVNWIRTTAMTTGRRTTGTSLTTLRSTACSSATISSTGAAVVPQYLRFRGETVYHSTQGHRCNFPSEVVEDFAAWLRSLDDSGYCGIPLEWQ